jgi:acyl carrier protein
MSAEPQSSDPIFDCICAAIVKVKPILGEAPMNQAMRFESLGLSSLERAIVVFEIEDAYDLSIIAANLDVFETLGEARDLVQSMLEKKT